MNRDELSDQIKHWRKHPEEFIEEYFGIKLMWYQKTFARAFGMSVLYPRTEIVINDENDGIGWEEFISQNDAFEFELSKVVVTKDRAKINFRNGSMIIIDGGS